VETRTSIRFTHEGEVLVYTDSSGFAENIRGILNPPPIVEEQLCKATNLLPQSGGLSDTLEECSAAPIGNNLVEQIHAWYEKQDTDHPETSYIIRSSLLVLIIMVAGAILDSNAFLRGVLFFNIIFLPIYYAIFCIGRWRTSNTGFFRNLWEFACEHLTFISVPVVEHREIYKNSAWVTYLLILVNEMIFYGVQPEFPFILNKLSFVPNDHEWVNFPLGLIGSMFLHGSDWHLWGNMLFLWCVGVVVERRIGWQLFLGGYLLSGMIASLLAADINYYLLGSEMHAIGASGAISGVMGMFIIRCYFKRMVFPIPFFGVLPISFKIKINSMAFIGLYFVNDVLAGYRQIVDDSFSPVAHWAHVGGMYAGMLIAATRRLEREADLEQTEELGMSTIRNGTLCSEGFDRMVGLGQTEMALTKVLAARPDNVTAMLQLARTKSHFSPDPEAKKLYSRVLDLLVSQDPKVALDVFREYHKKYLDIASPQIQYRLVPHLIKSGDYQMASRSLELIIAHPESGADLKGKAMFQCARLFDKMELPEAACQMRRSFLEAYPDSDAATKVQAALEG
jgi:membrane associated rhomboid family serine protease